MDGVSPSILSIQDKEDRKKISNDILNTEPQFVGRGAKKEKTGKTRERVEKLKNYKSLI